jgi:YaiO family outer membrane protein
MTQFSKLLLLGLISFAALTQDSCIWGQSASKAVDQDADATLPASVLDHAPVQRTLTSSVEAGGSYSDLTSELGFWRSGYMNSVLSQGRNTWTAEIVGEREFGDAGTYFAAGDTHDFTSDWYGSLTLGSSAGGFFWPRFRGDVFINKKWLARKQWITTAGFGYYAAKDVHRDHSFYVGSTYYFGSPWILETGFRLNISNPGTVRAPSGFAALTQGRDHKHYLTIRSGFAEEAYQLTGPSAIISDFASQELTVTWRQWVRRNWGINLIADYYRNPYYIRGGSSIGIFKEF